LRKMGHWDYIASGTVRLTLKRPLDIKPSFSITFTRK